MQAEVAAAAAASHDGSKTSNNKLNNVTEIIKSILDGYDIRLRPNFGGKISI